jgi:hypothetical protein
VFQELLLYGRFGNNNNNNNNVVFVVVVEGFTVRIGL